MQVRPTRPKVFVSSTIQDLRDVRSAIKYWLEEMGFQVQLSEYNDFDRKPELNAFQACFDAIGDCDYYILLIGGRRGSLYDEGAGVSVTQQEYRTAYEPAKAGRLKMAIFARQDVLNAKVDRAGTTQVEPAATAAPSPLVEDPAFVFAFIDEVSRAAEVAEAVAGEGQYPAANWVMPFATFRDIVDGLRSAFRITGPLEAVALLENLRFELEENLRILLRKHKLCGVDLPFLAHWWLSGVREEVTLTEEAIGGVVHLSQEHLRHVGPYLITSAPSPDALLTSALDDAISSGAFLSYDHDIGTYRPSPLLESLYALRKALHVYRTRFAGMQQYLDHWFELSRQANRGELPGGYSVPGDQFTLVFGLYDAQVELYRLFVGILRWLYGHTGAIEVESGPISPITGEDEKIRQDRPSREELQGWLQADVLRPRSS